MRFASLGEVDFADFIDDIAFQNASRSRLFLNNYLNLIVFLYFVGIGCTFSRLRMLKMNIERLRFLFICEDDKNTTVEGTSSAIKLSAPSFLFAMAPLKSRTDLDYDKLILYFPLNHDEYQHQIERELVIQSNNHEHLKKLKIKCIHSLPYRHSKLTPLLQQQNHSPTYFLQVKSRDS